MTTHYYHHPICREHVNAPGHPERPERLAAIEAALETDNFESLKRIEAPEADPEYFGLAHPQAHLKKMAGLIPEEGLVRVDADTSACPQTWNAVKRAVGAALGGVDDVFGDTADNVFTAIRPPGHHAEKTTAMGFCLVNSIAVAARYAQKEYGAERIAIVDFDVHHGNGTQDIFYDDPSVLFASSHQMPLYPGSGAINETGAGNIFNTPLRQGDTGDAFREAFRSRILPAVENFAPDLLLISAGFDAHHRDPLAGLELVADDFDWVTGKLMDIAEKHCDNRLVSLLEGGYDLEGLAESCAAHINRLMKG